MKKIVTICILICLIFINTPNTTVKAETKNINIIINGEIQQFKIAPANVNGSVLVPMRDIFEKFQATIKWDAPKQQVTANLGSTQIVLTINSTTASINNKTVSLNVAPQLIKGSSMVPLRFVGEALDAVVNWVPEKNAVDITSSIKAVNEGVISSNPTVKISDEEQIKNLINANNDYYTNKDVRGFMSTYVKIKETEAQLTAHFAENKFKQTIESIEDIKISGNQATAKVVRITDQKIRLNADPIYVATRLKNTSTISFTRINNEWKIGIFTSVSTVQIPMEEENDRILRIYNLQSKHLQFRESGHIPSILSTMDPEYILNNKDWATKFATDNFKFEFIGFDVLENTTDYVKAEIVVLYKKISGTNPSSFEFIDKTTSVIEYKKFIDGWKISGVLSEKSERVSNP
ncbi:copper amine oxidase N-terminal domain-containing protein [Paenibacillus sp. FSL E2-0230]|uniref:copper amine oxidase N-terminal domain-containing protein n=1 Tax=Paenibacillus sp. FSL E2-0230 TaxID=2954727 RepID=UPI0030CD222D